MRFGTEISVVGSMLLVVMSIGSCTKDSGPIYIPPDPIEDTIVIPPPPVDTTDTTIVRVITDADVARGFFLENFLPDPPNNTISFSDDLMPIFNEKCNFCHPSNGNLDLSENAAYDQLVNVVTEAYAPALRVVPFDTAASVMWHKIIDDGVYGLAMPPGGITLTQVEKDLMTDWILQGALNN